MITQPVDRELLELTLPIPVMVGVVSITWRLPGNSLLWGLFWFCLSWVSSSLCILREGNSDDC